MSEPAPTITYATSYAGHGTLTATAADGARHDVAVAYWRAERPTYGVTEPWTVELRVAPGDQPALRALINARPQGDMRLEGALDWGAPAVLPALRWRVHEMFAGVLRAEAYELHTGEGTLLRPPAEQWATVEVTATSLARPAHRLMGRNPSTGEIRPDPVFDSELPPLEIRTDLGEYHLGEEYAFPDVQVGAQTAVVRVPQSVLRLTPTGGPRAPPGALVEAVVADVRDPLRVLTILSRSPVSLVRATVHSYTPGSPQSQPGEDEYVWSECTWHQTPTTPGQDRRVPPLLVAERLPAAALGRMVAACAASPYREALLTAAAWFGGYFGRQFVEQKVVTAFTALEALVQGIDKVDRTGGTAPAGAVDRMRRRLRGVLRDERESLGLTAEQVALVEAKLPELGRASIQPRVLACVERFRVRYADLWTHGTDLDDALGQAFRLRNALVHTGELRDVDAASDAGDRVHALAERLAYRLLGGDDAWLDRFAYYHVYGVSGEYPPVTAPEPPGLPNAAAPPPADAPAPDIAAVAASVARTSLSDRG